MSEPALTDTRAVILDIVAILIALMLIGVAGYLASRIIAPAGNDTPVVSSGITMTGTDEAHDASTETVSVNPDLAPDIDLVNIQGRVVINNNYETLLMISGRAENRSSMTRSSITLLARLMDSNGNTLGEKTFYAGTSISEQALIEAPKPVHAYLNNLENAHAEPGKAIPFTVVFDNLPDTLKEFSVDVVGASE